MSHLGKLARGKKWYSNRVALQLPEHSAYGELFLPNGILNDANKMKDVDFYIKYQNTPLEEIISIETEGKNKAKAKAIDEAKARVANKPKPVAKKPEVKVEDKE